MFFVVRPNRAELIQIGNLIDTGFIRPVIEMVFPLSEARQAFERGLSLSLQVYFARNIFL